MQSESEKQKEMSQNFKKLQEKLHQRLLLSTSSFSNEFFSANKGFLHIYCHLNLNLSIKIKLFIILLHSLCIHSFTFSLLYLKKCFKYELKFAKGIEQYLEIYSVEINLFGENLVFLCIFMQSNMRMHMITNQ